MLFRAIVRAVSTDDRVSPQGGQTVCRPVKETLDRLRSQGNVPERLELALNGSAAVGRDDLRAHEESGRRIQSSQLVEPPQSSRSTRPRSNPQTHHSPSGSHCSSATSSGAVLAHNISPSASSQ